VKLASAILAACALAVGSGGTGRAGIAFGSAVGKADVASPALLSPFPIVQVSGKVARGGTRLKLLSVIAPGGAKVTIHCRGRGCPVRKQSFTARAKKRTGSGGVHAAGVIRVRRLEHRLLRAGVVIEIAITEPGMIGKYTRLVVRKGKPPKRTDRCLVSQLGEPVACPTNLSPGPEISDGSITNTKLADDAVTSNKIATNAVGSLEIQDGAVTSDEIADGAVRSAEILDGTIAVGDIAQSVWSGSVNQAGTLAARPPASASNNGFLYFATDLDGGTLYRSNGSSWAKTAAGVTEASIPDGSITTAKLADDAVTAPKIAADAVGSSEIVADAVGSTEIATDAVGAAEIATNGVGSAEIGDDAVTTVEILDATVTSADIAADTIAAGDIATGAVTTAEILDATVTSADILDSTITSGDILDATITATDILDSTITSSDVATDTIVAADIATGAVTTAEILDSTITSADIAAGAIQTSDLASGAAGESAYRLVEGRSGKLDRDTPAGTYLLPTGGTVGNNVAMESGVDLERDAGIFYLSAADHSISGRTTELRLRATLLANSTAPGLTIKVGLYPVTANGGANDKNNVTLGSVISEVTFSGTSANSHSVATSSGFSFPSDGFYAIGVSTSGTLANNSLVDLTAELQVHNL
jgi:hypothetical protein